MTTAQGKPLSNRSGIELAGHLLAQMLVDYGVTHVFGVPGGQTLALYDGINRLRPRITHVVMRDERSTAYAADCYARITGRVGVCDATVGPGATKLPSGLSEALNSSIPMLAVVSDLPLAYQGLKERGCASQGMNQRDMLRPMVKDLLEVRVDGELPAVVRRAFKLAVTGRPGPVAITIPEDLFEKPVGAGRLEAEYVEPGYGVFPAERPPAGEEEIRQAAVMLAASTRPVLVAGGGAMISRTFEQVRVLAETAAAPVLTSFSGKGIIPEDHPLSFGLVGNMGTDLAREILEEADLVFLIGFKSGQNSTFGWKLPGPSQQVIHLDIDPAEIGKVFPTALGIAADAAEALAALVRHLEGTSGGERAEGRRRRTEDLARRKREWWSAEAERIKPAGERIPPQWVVHELNSLLGPEDVVVCDASFSSGWGGIYLQARAAGQRFIFPRGSAGLGFSLPAAIGACFTPGTRNVICLTGDGGITYALGELATMAMYGLRTIIVVLNNNAYGWIKWMQRLKYEGRYQSVDLPELDYSRVGPAFGLDSAAVERPEELRAALEQAFQSERGTIINVKTQVWETPLLSFQSRLRAEKTR